MTTKMQAPEGVSGAHCDGTDYEVADGLIEVENGEHVAHLERHGFAALPGVVTGPEPEAPPPPAEIEDPGDCPDFSKFSNRAEIVAWLSAHGVTAAGDDPRADLEAAAAARHAELVEAHAAQEAARSEA